MTELKKFRLFQRDVQMAIDTMKNHDIKGYGPPMAITDIMISLERLKAWQNENKEKDPEDT